MLIRVLELACRWVPGAEQASICRLPRDEGPLRTLAATGAQAVTCDKIQRDTEQAQPSMRPPTTPWFTPATSPTRPGGPGSPRKRDPEIRGVLTCELPMTRGVAATPNLCSTQPATFTTIGELIALVFAVHASTALAHADDVEHLYRAIESRRTVGLALGILVERHRLTPPTKPSTGSSRPRRTTTSNCVASPPAISDTGEEPADVAQGVTSRGCG